MLRVTVLEECEVRGIVTNILILSCGTRNKIIRYFKKALTAQNNTKLGNVVATDMSPLAPAIYEADAYYLVPRITAEGYIDRIMEICQKENICAVMSLIDPELSLLAKHEALFTQIGVQIIGSCYELCERALDKMEMYRWLKKAGYRAAKSYDDPELFFADLDCGKIQFPVFVKPIRGSASLSVNKVYDRRTLESLLEQNQNFLIQEYMNGQEIGADVYIDLLSGEVVSIFTKKKLAMRSGETDKAVSFKDEKLFALITSFCKDCGWRGQIDIDIFDIDGEYYISEVNPRFGGGYPHAYECGCDHMTLIVNNLIGKTNERNIGAYEEDVLMMKYVEVSVRKRSESRC